MEPASDENSQTVVKTESYSRLITKNTSLLIFNNEYQQVIEVSVRN